MKHSILLICLLGFLISCGNKSKTSEPPKSDDEIVVVNPPAGTVFVRQNIYDLAPDDPIVTGYQKAIKHMQSLPETDPTSWAYQSAIHGTNASGNQPGWNQCQHGSFFFISWHRMYLYYFERIIRKYSENPNWALPYWNYSTPNTRSIPAVFRDNTGDNPLYIPQRNASMNAGAELSSFTVSLACLEKIPFTGTPASLESFGGQTVPEPQHFFTGTGALENVPHNQVHVAIGGWMLNPNTAAQDPIFWLHHSNIDRLMNVWLNMDAGRQWTNNQTWLNNSFPFFDENGNEVTLTGAQILNSITQLNYRYDNDPVEMPTPSLAAADGSRETKSVMDGGEQDGKKILAQSADAETKFTHQPLSITLDMGDANSALLRKSTMEDPEDATGTYLTIEGLKFDKMPNQSIGIFINLPEGQEPDYNSVHFVDLITFFGIGHHVHHNEDGVNLTYKIDDNLAALSQAGIDISTVKVTFDLTNGVEKLEGFTEEPTNTTLDPEGSPRFRKVTIQVY